jgi:hypothetical protein
MLLDLSDPAKLKALVAPATDTQHERVKALLDVAYDMSWATLHDVTDIDVEGVELERPLFPPQRVYGTWMQTIPSHTRTDVSFEGLNGVTPAWIDATADLALTLILGEIDAGEIESVVTRSIDDFTTLAEFKAKFVFFDLDEFMETHEITTVDELKALGNFLLTEIKLKAVPPFDPDNPGDGLRFELHLMFLVRDTIDVAAGLRDAKLLRALVERSVAYRREVDPATEVLTPYAPILVFPQAAVAGTGFTEAELSAFFAGEDVLAVFTTP